MTSVLDFPGMVITKLPFASEVVATVVPLAITVAPTTASPDGLVTLPLTRKPWENTYEAKRNRIPVRALLRSKSVFIWRILLILKLKKHYDNIVLNCAA